MFELKLRDWDKWLPILIVELDAKPSGLSGGLRKHHPSLLLGLVMELMRMKVVGKVGPIEPF
jgi:hypothetical protein